MTMTLLESLQSTRRFLLGTWANGGAILPLSELLKEMGGDVSEERKCEMKALFDGRPALNKHFGIPK
jgi:hypothetical protein